jgi:hypothetical protein
MKRPSHYSSSNADNNGTGWMIFLLASAILLFTLGVFGVIGFGISIFTGNTWDIHRYCVFMNNDQVFESGGGDTNGWGFGYIEIDLNENKLSYDILFAQIETPSAMHIHGPVNADDPLTASVFIPSSGDSLDVAVVGGASVIGSVLITSTQAEAIVANPTLYYVLLKTEEFPSGAIGYRLGVDCRIQR